MIGRSKCCTGTKGYAAQGSQVAYLFYSDQFMVKYGFDLTDFNIGKTVVSSLFLQLWAEMVFPSSSRDLGRVWFIPFFCTYWQKLVSMKVPYFRPNCTFQLSPPNVHTSIIFLLCSLNFSPKWRFSSIWQIIGFLLSRLRFFQFRLNIGVSFQFWSEMASLPDVQTIGKGDRTLRPPPSGPGNVVLKKGRQKKNIVVFMRFSGEFLDHFCQNI